MFHRVIFFFPIQTFRSFSVPLEAKLVGSLHGIGGHAQLFGASYFFLDSVFLRG